MLQSALEIPQPSSADNETVITALETAALFGSKGDAQEAMRWLRRAAESAGEAGDDVRALALSRTAADLTEELKAKRERYVTPTPPPLPSVPRASAAPPSASAPPPSVRPSYPTPPSSRPESHSVGPSRPPAAPSTTTAAAPGPPRATRVSIQRSPTVPGVFEVRLLADGEGARSGDGEAFLVMVDPQSTLLSS